MTKATCKAYVGRVIPEKVRKKVVGGTQNHTNTSAGRGIFEIYRFQARQRARGQTQKNAKSKIKRKNQRNQNQYEVLKDGQPSFLISREIKIQKGGSMASGGARPGAGRPKKAVTQKILEGNPGKRPIEVVNFTTDNGLELPSEPPSYLSAKAKEIYKTVYAWLKSIGCTQGILPYNLEEYAFCKARWLECEDMNTKHGLLVKDQNGKPMPSPFVGMAQQYLKQTNEVWSKIYIVVRESKLSKWDETNPNDDIMEKLLGGKA